MNFHSAPRRTGVYCVYETYESRFTAIATPSDAKPNSAISGSALAVFGNSAIATVGAGAGSAATGALVCTTSVTGTSFCSGVTATISTVVRSAASTGTAGTGSFTATASSIARVFG